MSSRLELTPEELRLIEELRNKLQKSHNKCFKINITDIFDIEYKLDFDKTTCKYEVQSKYLPELNGIYDSYNDIEIATNNKINCYERRLFLRVRKFSIDACDSRQLGFSPRFNKCADIIPRYVEI